MLGIVSFVLSCGLLTGIPAVIVGNNAKKAVARGEANNGGMATAGIILGWIAIALSVLGIILFAILLANADFRDAFNEGYNDGLLTWRPSTTVRRRCRPARSRPTHPRRTGRAVVRR